MRPYFTNNNLTLTDITHTDWLYPHWLTVPTLPDIPAGNDVEIEGSPSMDSTGGSVKSMGGPSPSGFVSRSESLATGFEVEVEGSVSGDEHD